MAFSPDGRSLFFTASPDGTSAKSALYLRPLDKAEASPIPGTEGAREPFISPDGQWVGFWAQGKLKKVSSSGGLIPTVLCECPNIPQGATWSEDGRIIIGTDMLGLRLLDNEGGKLKNITVPDPTKEMSHVLPSFLPGGRAILFSVKIYGWGPQSRIESLELDSGERKLLVEDAAIFWVPTDGTRFLMIRREEVKPIEVTRLSLVQNWFEELKRLAPAK